MISQCRFLQCFFSWLIDFNGILTSLELFYTSRLGNYVYGTFIFIFWYSFLRVFCTWLYDIKYSYLKQFLKRSIWAIDWDLTDTTTFTQSGPGSNGNEGLLHTPHSFRTGVLPLDAFGCHILNAFILGRILPLSLLQIQAA